jgi:hypothetical protein
VSYRDIGWLNHFDTFPGADYDRPRYMTKGYTYVQWPEHPHANRQGRVREHIAVAMDALGHKLPKGAVVHHVNDDKSDNRKDNLVICQNDAYHKLLHYRRRIFRAGGNPDTDRICSACQKVISLTKFSPTGSCGLSRECRPCAAARQRRTNAARLEALLCEITMRG